jgi:hypothetical protein
LFLSEIKSENGSLLSSLTSSLSSNSEQYESFHKSIVQMIELMKESIGSLVGSYQDSVKKFEDHLKESQQTSVSSHSSLSSFLSSSKENLTKQISLSSIQLLSSFQNIERLLKDSVFSLSSQQNTLKNDLLCTISHNFTSYSERLNSFLTQQKESSTEILQTINTTKDLLSKGIATTVSENEKEMLLMNALIEKKAVAFENTFKEMLASLKKESFSLVNEISTKSKKTFEQHIQQPLATQFSSLTTLEENKAAKNEERLKELLNFQEKSTNSLLASCSTLEKSQLSLSELLSISSSSLEQLNKDVAKNHSTFIEQLSSSTNESLSLLSKVSEKSHSDYESFLQTSQNNSQEIQSNLTEFSENQEMSLTIHNEGLDSHSKKVEKGILSEKEMLLKITKQVSDYSKAYHESKIKPRGSTPTQFLESEKVELVVTRDHSIIRNEVKSQYPVNIDEIFSSSTAAAAAALAFPSTSVSTVSSLFPSVNGSGSAFSSITSSSSSSSAVSSSSNSSSTKGLKHTTSASSKDTTSAAQQKEKDAKTVTVVAEDSNGSQALKKELGDYLKQYLHLIPSSSYKAPPIPSISVSSSPFSGKTTKAASTYGSEVDEIGSDFSPMKPDHERKD